MLRLFRKYWLRFKSILGLYRIGIYITDEALYYLEIERDVISYHVKNIDVEWFLPGEDLSAPIRRLADRYPHIRDHPIYSNISEKSTISAFIVIPKMSNAEIRKAIPLEVSRHLPYNPETMEYGYQVFSGESESKTLAIVAKKNKIEELWYAFEEADLQLRQISISNYAFINAIRDPGRSADGYLYPEPSSCTINIFQRGILDFSYTSYAKNLILQLKDIDRAVAQYRALRGYENRFSVLRFIGDLSAFPESEKGRFLKYFLTIEKEINFVFPTESVEKFFVELPAMVGIALQRRVSLDLLPAEFRKQSNRFMRDRYRWVALFAAQVILFLGTIYAYLNSSILNLQEDILFYKSARHNSSGRTMNLAHVARRGVEIRAATSLSEKTRIYQEQIEYVESLQQKVRELEKIKKLYEQYNRNRSILSYFLHGLSRYIPEGVRISEAEFPNDYGFRLTGFAESEERLNKFLRIFHSISASAEIIKIDLKDADDGIRYEITGKW